MTSRLHSSYSVSTVDLDFFKKRREQSKLPVEPRRAPDRSFDVAVVEFEDDGSFGDPRQLTAATDHIQSVRRSRNWHGVIVVVFIHGWRHDARWEGPVRGDKHFRSFRDVLAFLTGREIERQHGARRVVGIYVGWDGKARKTALGSTLGRLSLDHPTFWNRYETALRIGQGQAMQELAQQLIRSTKGPGRRPGQLVLMGHSMGGLILESTLLGLVQGGGGNLLEPWPERWKAPVHTQIRKQPVLFPDAVISLNSAADSDIASTLVGELEQRQVVRRVVGGKDRYEPPLLVSVTSKADEATGKWWPRGMGSLRRWRRMRRRAGRPARDSLIREFRPREKLRTVGHQPDLLSHRLRAGAAHGRCVPRRALVDLFQEFHCLREPDPPTGAKTPTIVVDLPDSKRRLGSSYSGIHRRYRLEPLKAKSRPQRLWNLQVPKSLIPNHNDIFNYRAKALILALMQASGAVASLAKDWDDSFEPE